MVLIITAIFDYIIRALNNSVRRTLSVTLLSYKQNALERGSSGKPPAYRDFNTSSAPLWCWRQRQQLEIRKKGIEGATVSWSAHSLNMQMQHSFCLLDIVWVGVLHIKLLACRMPMRGEGQMCAFPKFFFFPLSCLLWSVALRNNELVVFHLLLICLQKAHKVYMHNTTSWYFNYHLGYPHTWDTHTHASQ